MAAVDVWLVDGEGEEMDCIVVVVVVAMHCCFDGRP